MTYALLFDFDGVLVELSSCLPCGLVGVGTDLSSKRGAHLGRRPRTAT